MSKHYSMVAETPIQTPVLALVHSPSWGTLLIALNLKILIAEIVVSGSRAVVHSSGWEGM